MAARIRLELSAEQRQELEQLVRRHPLAYLRERAGALLKIADGQTPRQVALSGLRRRRAPDTVYSWVRRYQAEGVAGLRVQPGRGRKAAFSPLAAGCEPRAGGAGGAGPAGASGVRARAKPLDADESISQL